MIYHKGLLYEVSILFKIPAKINQQVKILL